MKFALTSSIVALGLLAVTPVMAQGVYIGPGGVGVDTGIRPYGYHSYYDGDRYYRHHYRDRDYYEGRSAYDRDER